MSLLEKLAAEVKEDDSKKPEGTKPIPKKESGNPEDKSPKDEKKDGGFPPKKEDSAEQKDGNGGAPEDKKSEQKSEGSEPANTPVPADDKSEPAKGEAPVAGEQEIEGNESAEGPAVPGTGAVDPLVVVDFFEQNPVPGDESFHEFAEANGYDIHQAESIAYALAGKYVMFLRGGKSQGYMPEGVDPQQIEAGMQIESEHTADPASQKKIATDHLTEDSEYYTHLAEMEQQYSAKPNDAGADTGNTGAVSQQSIGDGNSSFQS